MTVTFCGHRQIAQSGELAKWLDLILPSLIEGGAATFYLGGYGAFDSLAAAAVRRQKAVYPHIEAVLVQPYLNREFDVSRYDSATYPPLEHIPPRFAVAKRNEWMVCASDVIVSGVTRSWGGAAKTLDYARRRQKVIFQFPMAPAETAGGT